MHLVCTLLSTGCRKRSAAKGVRSLFSFSGRFRSLFGHFFLMLLSLFSSLFCQTPFAGLLLRQGELRNILRHSPGSWDAVAARFGCCPALGSVAPATRNYPGRVPHSLVELFWISDSWIQKIYMALDWSAANILARNLIFVQFYSKNGPNKYTEIWCNFAFFCSPQIFFISPEILAIDKAIVSRLLHNGPSSVSQIGTWFAWLTSCNSDRLLRFMSSLEAPPGAITVALMNSGQPKL